MKSDIFEPGLAIFHFLYNQCMQLLELLNMNRYCSIIFPSLSELLLGIAIASLEVHPQLLYPSCITKLKRVILAWK